MRAVVISRQGTPVAPNIEVRTDWPDVVAARGEVLVRTEAAGLNHLDLWVGRGVPGQALEYPRITGSEGCGRVEAVGDGVDESWIGRRIVMNAAITHPDPVRPDVTPGSPRVTVIGEHAHGAMAERFTVPATNVLDVGEVDSVDAAAFALGHLTAWRMMVSRARLRPGHTVLITGIGGGVALAALNIARHHGCRTIVTSRHASKLALAAELGADHGVLDRGEDWSRDVRGYTGKRGVDICVDSIGKAAHLAGIKSLARGGVYVTCGCTTGSAATTDLARVFWNELSILGSTMGDMNEFRDVIALLVRGAMRPVVDAVFDADDAARAYARLESGEQFGKVLVRW